MFVRKEVPVNSARLKGQAVYLQTPSSYRIRPALQDAVNVRRGSRFCKAYQHKAFLFIGRILNCCKRFLGVFSKQNVLSWSFTCDNVSFFIHLVLLLATYPISYLFKALLLPDAAMAPLLSKMPSFDQSALRDTDSVHHPGYESSWEP